MISIIVPLYNKANSIAQCIESILTQTYKEWECIIIDDGSTDDSFLIISKYLPHPQIYYYKKKNGGVSSARNTGISYAKGEWICFLDADDYLLPNGLEDLLKPTIRSKVSMVSGNFYINKNGIKELYIKNSKNTLIKNGVLAHFKGNICPRCGAYICQKTILKKYPFNEKLSRYEDVDVILNLLAECNIASIKNPVMVYTSDYNDLSIHKNIQKDYLSCLKTDSKNFWIRLFNYKFMYEAWRTYPKEHQFLIKKYGKYIFHIFLSTFLYKTLRIITRH